MIKKYQKEYNNYRYIYEQIIVKKIKKSFYKKIKRKEDKETKDKNT